MLTSPFICSIGLLAIAVCASSGVDHDWDEEPDRRNLNNVEQPGELKDELAYSSCPEGYPAFGTLGDLLRAWNPNDPDVPEGVVEERLHVSGVDSPALCAFQRRADAIAVITSKSTLVFRSKSNGDQTQYPP